MPKRPIFDYWEAAAAAAPPLPEVASNQETERTYTTLQPCPSTAQRNYADKIQVIRTEVIPINEARFNVSIEESNGFPVREMLQVPIQEPARNEIHKNPIEVLQNNPVAGDQNVPVAEPQDIPIEDMVFIFDDNDIKALRHIAFQDNSSPATTGSDYESDISNREMYQAQRSGIPYCMSDGMQSSAASSVSSTSPPPEVVFTGDGSYNNDSGVFVTATKATRLPTCQQCGAYLQWDILLNMRICHDCARKRSVVTPSKPRKKKSTATEPKKCSNCNTSLTTLWRKNLTGQYNCNPCGLYKKTNGENRPPILWSDEIKKRQKKSVKISKKDTFRNTGHQDYEMSVMGHPQLASFNGGHYIPQYSNYTNRFNPALPSNGYSPALPTNGYSPALPTNGYSSAWPFNGYGSASTSNGYSQASSSNGSLPPYNNSENGFVGNVPRSHVFNGPPLSSYPPGPSSRFSKMVPPARPSGLGTYAM